MDTIKLPKHRRNLIVAVMLISAFVAILNQTLLNTALPHIMRELKINENTSQWLITGFVLVNGVMIPLTASDVYKRQISWSDGDVFIRFNYSCYCS